MRMSTLYSEDAGKMRQRMEKCKSGHEDLLEPEFYPDPILFRKSLENLTRDDIELLQNLTSNKTTIQVLAPYLRIMRRKIMECVRQSPGRPQKAVEALLDHRVKKQAASTTPDISEKTELVLSIHETADVLQKMLGAKTAVSYFVDLERGEIFQSPRHVESSTANLTWKIEEGSTMAAHVAFNKRYEISQNVAADFRYPLGVGFPDSMTKCGLCVPVKTPEGDVVAVYEFTRDAFDVPFDKRDVQLVLAVAGWMGVAVFQNSLYTRAMKKLELTNYLTQLTSHYHSGAADVQKTLSDITLFARETIGAERCNLYVVNKLSKGKFTVEEYDQNVDSAKVLRKRRTKKYVNDDSTLLGHALIHKQSKTLHSPGFEVATEGPTPVRSAICVPVLENKEPIGAVQLTNKLTSSEFNRTDIDTLELFATYLSINMAHLKLNEKLKKSDLNNKVTQEMLFHHIKPCVHEQEAIKNSPEELPDEFFTFSWYPSPDDTPKLVEMAISMFHEVLGDSFMALNNVPKFILTVKNCYRPNAYHNFVHAFGVAHAMANIITRYHKVFTGLERKGLMVAALCHDVDHRGYNNNFLQLTQHHLAVLYDSSPLENHHFAVTKMVIQQCGLFKYFTTPIYNDLLTEVYEAIIATDLSLYFQCRIELMKIADEKSFTFTDPDHRRLVKNLMMTASDLSGQTKPMAICEKITRDVYEEFFQQGDVEKRMGYFPLPTMDREMKGMIYENQVQFMTVVLIPCVETVSRIFNSLTPVVWEAKQLLQQWKELLVIKRKDLWRPEDSLSVK